jgi:ferredoxin
VARLAGGVGEERRGLTRFVALVAACQGCGACLLTCPEHAIRPRREAGATAKPAALDVRQDRCTGCGECVEVCPVDAIELVAVERSALERSALERTAADPVVTTRQPVPHHPKEVQTG